MVAVVSIFSISVCVSVADCERVSFADEFMLFEYARTPSTKASTSRGTVRYGAILTPYTFSAAHLPASNANAAGLSISSC